MNLQELMQNGQRLLRANSPTILTGIGVAGTVATAVLTAKGAFKAAEIIRADEALMESMALEAESKKDRTARRAKSTWTCYVPGASAAAVSIVAVLSANHAHAQRTAAALAAYSMTERAFGEYKEQAIKHLGDKGEAKVREDVAAKRVLETAPESGTVVIGSGDVLCLEQHTGRYFMSTMEKIRQAINDVNDQINHQLYVNLDTLYDELGLPHTHLSNQMGWDFEYGLVEARFETVLTEDQRPCLAFSYSYLKPV